MNTDNITEILNQYYKNDYNENERLTKDKSHYIEFITTTHYIDKYLKTGDRILEVGAGTGAYSLYYANKGYQVDALELIKSNIDIMNSNIKNNMNIKTIQGNALDLSLYEDNTFDITLVLGPLYHLFSKEEQQQAIKEAIRVTKKGGIIYIAFILFDLTMLTWGLKKGNVRNNIGIDKEINIDYTPNNHEEYIFNLMYYDEAKKLISEFRNVDIIHNVATDGVGKVIDEIINNMDEEMYKHYINYHLSICEREDLIGYSGHILTILRKKV